MIDPTFRNIKRLFILSFKNSYNDPTRLPSDRYYMSSLEDKDFNVLIEKKSFFNEPTKNSHMLMKNVWKRQEMITIKRESY